MSSQCMEAFSGEDVPDFHGVVHRPRGAAVSESIVRDAVDYVVS
jgi:hypothetical protein